MDFFIGGTAAMCAGVFSNPFDVIKTRQQLQGELRKGKISKQPYRGLWNSVRSIVRAEGLFGLQKGLGPALSFQFILNSTRLGLFQKVDDFHWTKWRQDGDHSTILCMFWGAVAGVSGSFFGCPLYLLKTQMQSKSVGEFAVGYQHNHKSTLDGLILIVKKHGLKGLWRGFSALAPRTAIGSSAQLATFSNAKDILLQYEVFQKSTFLTASSSSMISGFFTVVFMTPFDVVATRMFNQGVDVNGRGILYRNLFDCFIKTFKIEGIRGLYKGFTPNYWRTAPHTVLNLTFWEQFKKWRDLYLADESDIYFE